MHVTKVKGILSAKNGMNLFRGCTHGCIYCDSRSSCYQMKHAFEDVEMKENALELLEHSLKGKRKKAMIGMGSMTDPYLPFEETRKATRQALEIIYRYGFGVTLITKSASVLEDIDYFQKINQATKCVIQMTLTTFDSDLCAKVEPRVSHTQARIEALKRLRDAEIPTVVWLSPILPFINDTQENLLAILEACKEAQVYGIICFGMGVTLRDGNREYFYQALDWDFPGLKARYVESYGKAYVLPSPKEPELMAVFYDFCQRNGIETDLNKLFAYLKHFERNKELHQLSLFES